MNGTNGFDRTLSDWLQDTGAPEAPARVFEAAFAEARKTRRARPVPAPIARWLPMSTTFDAPVSTLRARWTMVGIAGLVMLALVAAGMFAAGSPRPIDRLTGDLGVFEAVGSIPGRGVVTSAVSLADGSVLVVAQQDLFRFDPSTGMFSPAGRLANGRMFESTVRLREGKVLIVGGGQDGVSPPPPEGYIAEMYDPVSGTVTTTGGTVQPRMAASAVVLQDGRVLVTGGESFGATATAETYDPATGTFTATGSMSRPRSYHASVLLRNGHVLVVGGDGAAPDAAAELYDPATGTFRPTGPMAFPQTHATVSVLPDGRVLLAGGISGGPAPDQTMATARVQVYDPATDRFTEVGPLPRARTYHSAVTLADGRVLVMGGVLEPRSRDNVTADAQVFDPATGRFSPAGTMTEARFNFHAVPIADGVLVVGHHWLNQLMPSRERGRDPYIEEERIQRSAEVYR